MECNIGKIGNAYSIALAVSFHRAVGTEDSDVLPILSKWGPSYEHPQTGTHLLVNKMYACPVWELRVEMGFRSEDCSPATSRPGSRFSFKNNRE